MIDTEKQINRRPMCIAKLNQMLYEDLEGHAAILDWSALELIEIAKRINDAGLSGDAMALVEVGKMLRAQHEIVISLADDTQDGLIVRIEP